MKIITFTKKKVIVLIFASAICLFVELIGYFQLNYKSLNTSWRGVLFGLVGPAIILCARPYFPSTPKSLRNWLYFMAIALFLNGMGQLSEKLCIYQIFIYLLNVGSQAFYLMSLLVAIKAYKNIGSYS